MKVKIIAECSQNHAGSMESAKQMILRAHLAGVDYVKFQLIKADLLFSSNNPLYAPVKQAELGVEQLAELKRLADQQGIGFGATPFYPEAVQEIASLDPAFIKIREKDSSNAPLIEAALATGRLILISAVLKPTQTALTYLRYHPQIRWLYCIPKYPPSEQDMDFRASLAFNGLSDHYPNITAALAFTALMLEHGHIEVFLEKHVTLDKRVPTIDQAVSIDFTELNNLVEHSRRLEKMRFEFL